MSIEQTVGCRESSTGATLPGSWTPWIGSYLTYLAAAGRPPSTRELRRHQLRYIARTLNCEPAVVDNDRLLAWLDAHVDRWKPETMRSHMMALRGFFGWTFQTGRTEQDPTVLVPRMSARRGLPRPVPEEVWRAAAANADGRVMVMLRLAAEAGLRRGEIARLQVGDIHRGLEGTSLLVRGKGGRDRRVPINDSLTAALAGISNGSPWLFPSQSGGHVSAPWVGKLCSLALGGKWTLHTLRHRFGTMAYSGTRDLLAVQQLLGHASPSTTQIYVAVNETALRTAMMGASDHQSPSA